MIKITKFNGLEQAISMPVQIQESLDESLDLMYVELKNLDYNTPFNILKPIEIEITDGKTTKVLNMVVESDNVVEVIKNKKYNHNLMLIEETKLTERYFVDKSVNQRIDKIIKIPDNVIIEKEKADIKFDNNGNVSYIQLDNVYNTYNNGEGLPYYDMFPNMSWAGTQDHYIYFTDSQGNNIQYTGGVLTPLIPKDDLLQDEVYTLRFYARYNNIDGSTPYYEYTFSFVLTGLGKPYVRYDVNTSGIDTTRVIKKIMIDGLYSYYFSPTLVLPSFLNLANNFTNFDIKYFVTQPEYFDIKINVTDQKGNEIKFENGITTPLIISDIKNDSDNIYNITYRSTSKSYETVYIEFTYKIHHIFNEEIIINTETVEEVINTLCITAETIRQSEMPKYSLANIEDYNKSDKYKAKIQEIYNSTCPEFSFGKMSLFEALMQIGGRFNFQPRVKNNKIFLDLLGAEEKIEDIGEYYSNTTSQSSNNFCSKLDSFASNITGIEDYEDGTDITPMLENYKTVRAEYGQTQIKDDNIIFATEYPIEKPIKLEIGFVSLGIVGDITAYLYEDSEYNLLSSFENKYGSKNHAIKYTRGQKNITGLSYKRDVPKLNEATNYIAIKNIILNRLGLRNLDINFQELQFRLIYIPIIDARITQLNSYKSLGSEEIALSYNQSASKISSNAYGNNLKTNVSMMGNIDSTKMFKLPKLEMLPEIGKRYDDKYVITTVKSEYYPNFIKCELGLTENYTRKNEYIGLDSNLDIHELDRQNAIDRHIIYEDICEISHTFNNEFNNSSLITVIGIEEFSNTFINQSRYTQPKISYVIATGYDEDEKSLGSFDIPLVSLGFGNSMALIYSYPDAIFTEPSVVYREQGFIDNISGAFREQYYSRYTDEYGKLDTLKLEYSTPKSKADDYSNSVIIGNELPKHQSILEPIVFFSTGDDKLQIKKDTAERLSITYQMHFVKDSLTLNDYIIGSAMASKNNLISGVNSYEYQLFFLKDKVNKNQDKISLDNAVKGQLRALPTPLKNEIDLGDTIVPAGEYEAWAFVNIKNDENDLILAENRKMKGGEIISMPHFNFKHKRR